MKKKVIAITITLLVVTAGALTLVQCDHSNMARVTIHIQNDLYAQKSESIIDKILNLLSTKAYAFNAWTDHSPGEILLQITASGMATIETTISPMESTFTTSVPAGPDRTIKLVYDNGGSYTPQRPYGAIKTISLDPGENDITIEMLPMTSINVSSYYDQAYSTIYVNLYDVQTTVADSYNIYRSTSLNGSYDYIGNTTTNQFEDLNYEIFKTYYYKVSVMTTDGRESLQSEPSAGIEVPF